MNEQELLVKQSAKVLNALKIKVSGRLECKDKIASDLRYYQGYRRGVEDALLSIVSGLPTEAKIQLRDWLEEKKN